MRAFRARSSVCRWSCRLCKQLSVYDFVAPETLPLNCWVVCILGGPGGPSVCARRHSPRFLQVLRRCFVRAGGESCFAISSPRCCPYRQSRWAHIYISASQREVNHGAMEFTRGSKQRTHGTQCIDRMWRSLKNFMPRGLNSKARHALNDSVKTYVWAFVCRTHVRGHKLLHSLGALAKAKNDD